MTSVAQFVVLGAPDFTPSNQQEWFFDLPETLDSGRVGAVLFRVDIRNSPRIAVHVNNKTILKRDFPTGMVVSFHADIPAGFLRPGKNTLLFEINVPDDNGVPSGIANIGVPVVYYHVRLAAVRVHAFGAGLELELDRI
jgi:hypothetical protein